MDKATWFLYARTIILALRSVFFEKLNSPSLRRKLLRLGDSIEFVKDSDEADFQTYVRATIIEKLPIASVKKSSLFNQELIDYYEHYYLIKIKKKTLIIPFEWIIAIETELEVE